MAHPVNWSHTNNSQHLLVTQITSFMCQEVKNVQKYLQYLRDISWESCRHKLTVSTDQCMVHTRWLARLHQTHERPAPVLAQTTVCQSVSKNEVYKNSYRRCSCTSKTAKIHRFVRFVMYCFITTVLVAFYWARNDETVHYKCDETVNFCCFRCATTSPITVFINFVFYIYP